MKAARGDPHRRRRLALRRQRAAQEADLRPRLRPGEHPAVRGRQEGGRGRRLQERPQGRARSAPRPERALTRVAITGATGWLGRAAAERAAGRGDEVLAFASARKPLRLDDGTTLTAAPLAELPDTPHDVLLHFAYATREHAARRPRVRATNVAITATVVEAIARQRPAAVVYASSGAVYRGEGGGWPATSRADPYGDAQAPRRADAARRPRRTSARPRSSRASSTSRGRGCASAASRSPDLSSRSRPAAR